MIRLSRLADYGVVLMGYMATHEDHHLDHVLEVFEKLGREFGLINPSQARAVSSTASPES